MFITGFTHYLTCRDLIDVVDLCFSPNNCVKQNAIAFVENHVSQLDLDIMMSCNLDETFFKLQGLD